MRLLYEPQGRRRIVSARIGLEIRPEIRRYIDHVNIRRLLFLPLLQNRVETRARRTYVIEDLGDFDLPLRRIEWLTAVDRSEERRVGNEVVSTCRSRCSP